MVATTHTVSLQGAVGHVVDVQVDLSDGLLGTALVGRPDASISEARDRCRAAVINSELHWPNTRRITVLLSPADLPKRGPHFDLAIAVAVLAAAKDRKFPHDTLVRAAMIGELTLDGRVRCVPGVLPMTMAAAARGIETVYVPEPQAAEAAMVPGMQVFGIRSLGQVMALLTGEEVPDAPRGGADVGLAVALLARGGAAGGPRHGRPRRDARHALRRRGRGRRRPPPDADRARRARARPPSPSGSPACCPTSATTSRSS